MTGVRVRLTFPEDLVRQPVLSRLALDHGVVSNIRRAAVEEDRGWIVCELDGPPLAVERGLAWLGEQGIHVDLLGDVLES